MRIISVTSGKGGVGKTSVSANLGIKLAENGWRTAMLDCDFGLANLALNMGIDPKATLQNVINRECTIVDALTEGPAGVQVLAGCSGVLALADLDYDRLETLSRGFDELAENFDFLILDTAAGISEGVMSSVAASDEVVLVFTPDPSSMMDAYANVKVLFQRKPGAIVNCVVNMVDSEAEAKALYSKLHTIVRDFLQERISYAGCIRRDENVIRATRERRPYVMRNKRTLATKDIGLVANHISGMPPARPSRLGFIARWLARNKNPALQAPKIA